MSDKTNWDNSTPGKFLEKLADTISKTYETNARYTEYENGSASLIVANDEGSIKIVLSEEDIIIYFDDDSDKTIRAHIDENTTYSTIVYRCLADNKCLLNPLASTITDAILTIVITP